MTDYVIFDVETTGLPLPGMVDVNKQPKIIELGAARVAPDGEILDELSVLVNPGEQISDEITKITGITNDDLKDQRPFKDHLDRLKELFVGCTFLVAHNAPFDKSLLSFELERLKVTDFPWPSITVCTVQEFYHIKGRRMKLTQLYQHFVGEELAQTHRALDDVKALHETLMAAKFFELGRTMEG